MNIGLLPINLGACGFYRIVIPYRKLQERYKDITTKVCFTHSRNSILEAEWDTLKGFISDKDIVNIQRRYGQDWETFVTFCKSKNKKVIYEIDDTFEKIPINNLPESERDLLKPQTLKSILWICHLVDIITVSTPQIKEWLMTRLKPEHHSKIKVLKNTLDFSLYPAPSFQKEKKSNQQDQINLFDDSINYAGISKATTKLRIGWAGARYHWEDLNEIAGALSMLNHERNGLLKFYFMGYIPETFWTLCPNNIVFRQGVGFLNYPEALNNLSLDIGLAPLKDNFFNRCKSELRYLEYSALGIPTVASKVTPFRRAINGNRGILVDNKPKKWKNAISLLIDDPDLRLKMAQNSYEYVFREYNIDTYINEWYKVLDGRNY